MATLTLIGEPFPDAEAAVHAEAARELTRAIAENAPRGCSARLLVAADRTAPVFENARASTERLPLNSAILPMLWRAGVTARPLDGEMVHAPTPMIALRTRGDHDVSQTTVMVPHALGWLAPEAMGSANARQYRAFVKRAIKRADVIVAPTHATAAAVQERYGAETPVQVIPLAAPAPYLAGDDAAERRSALGLPDRYLITTATPGDPGRLEWLFSALEADPSLPPLVVVLSVAPADGKTVAGETAAGKAAADKAGDDETVAGETGDGEAAERATPHDEPAPHEVDAARAAVLEAAPAAIRDRVLPLHPRELADIGAMLAAAELLVMPQRCIGAGFEVLGALAAGVPVVHGGNPAVAELALDSGVAADGPEALASELARLSADADERSRLAVLAADRSRSFTWAGAAIALWELHANI